MGDHLSSQKGCCVEAVVDESPQKGLSQLGLVVRPVPIRLTQLTYNRNGAFGRGWVTAKTVIDEIRVFTGKIVFKGQAASVSKSFHCSGGSQ